MRVGSRLRYVLAIAAFAGLAWAAAPALSTNRYMPAAVDFEQPLTGVERVADAPAARQLKASGEGAVSFRSAPIEAPKRFDLAGLAGERRELELRARDSGGEWSEWVEAQDGNPVYFGGADEIQLRTRGWRPSGRLHYVNVSGTTSATESLLTRFRESVNSAFIGAAGSVDAEAEALPARPRIVTRREWGATRAKGGCPPRTTPSRGKVKAAVVHHTVTANDYTPQEAPAIVLGICRYHRNANGWNDIGYNALVDRFGTIYQGRAGGMKQPVVGAHAQGFNAQTTGVAAIGTHSAVGITPAALSSLVDYLAWKLSVHGIPARGKVTMTSAGGSLSRYPDGRRVRLNRIVGHRQVGLTACPGDGLFGQLTKIRRRTQRLIDDAGGTTPTEPPITDPPTTAPGGGTGGLPNR